MHSGRVCLMHASLADVAALSLGDTLHARPGIRALVAFSGGALCRKRGAGTGSLPPACLTLIISALLCPATVGRLNKSVCQEQPTSVHLAAHHLAIAATPVTHA